MASTSKAKFDAALLVGERVRQSTFSNTEAGFEQFLGWLMRHRADPSKPLHACMEATGNWGLDLAGFLYAHDVQISIVNPARIKAYGASELVRNKTDRLPTSTSRLVEDPGRRSSDRPVLPCASTSGLSPPSAYLREPRDLVRRCDALKAARTQELNRQKAGFASPAVAASIAAHLAWLDQQIDTVLIEVRRLIDDDPILRRTSLSSKASLALATSRLPACSRNFLTLSSSRLKRLLPSPACRRASTPPVVPGAAPVPSAASAASGYAARCSCARLSAKRTNKALGGFVDRMTAAGKPPKVILIAVARKLLVYAHAVIRAQMPFHPRSADPSPA
ncbi:IS110 family transposase [Geminicoccus flavidas]|nr:transposase [Geminicoccus flavidas]